MPLGLEVLFYMVVALGMWVLWPGSYPSAEEEFIAGFNKGTDIETFEEAPPKCSHCGDCGFLPPYSVDWETSCYHCNAYQEILLIENPPEPVRRREAIAATKQKHRGNKTWTERIWQRS